MKIRFVGRKMLRRNFGQRVIPLQLFDDQLDPRPSVVKLPDVERIDPKIRDDHLIAVFPQRKQRQLVRRLLGNRPSDHDKTIGLLPFGGLIDKFRGLGAGSVGLVGQGRKLPFDRLGQASDDGKKRFFRFQIFDRLVVVKTLVSPYNFDFDGRGKLSKCRLEKLDRSGGRVRVAGTQFSMPVIARKAIETQQGMIRRPSFLGRVVSDDRRFLLSVKGQNRRVEIEDDFPRSAGLGDHRQQHSVVQSSQSAQRQRGQAQKESSQRGRIGVSR